MLKKTENKLFKIKNNKMKNKTIKTIALLTLVTLFTQFISTSCKKYPDGPTISLRSRAERVANTWKIENYKINSTDFTSLVSGYNETFTKKGAYSYIWGILSGSGTWKFQNKDTEIKLSGNDSHSSRTLYILKLEENSFWYYTMDGNDKHEYHLVSK